MTVLCGLCDIDVVVGGAWAGNRETDDARRVKWMVPYNPDHCAHYGARLDLGSRPHVMREAGAETAALRLQLAATHAQQRFLSFFGHSACRKPYTTLFTLHITFNTIPEPPLHHRHRSPTAARLERQPPLWVRSHPPGVFGASAPLTDTAQVSPNSFAGSLSDIRPSLRSSPRTASPSSIACTWT